MPAFTGIETNPFLGKQVIASDGTVYNYNDILSQIDTRLGEGKNMALGVKAALQLGLPQDVIMSFPGMTNAAWAAGNQMISSGAFDATAEGTGAQAAPVGSAKYAARMAMGLDAYGYPPEEVAIKKANGTYVEPNPQGTGTYAVQNSASGGLLDTKAASMNFTDPAVVAAAKQLKAYMDSASPAEAARIYAEKKAQFGFTDADFQQATFDPVALGLDKQFTGGNFAASPETGSGTEGTQTGWSKSLGNGTTQQYDMAGNKTTISQDKDQGDYLNNLAALAAIAVTAGGAAGAGPLGGLLGGGASAVASPVLSGTAVGTDLAALGGGAAAGGGTVAGMGGAGGLVAPAGALGVGGAGGLGTTLGAVGAAGAGGIGTVLGGAGAAGTIGTLLKDYAPIIGAGVGALSGSQDTTKTDSVKKEPWAEAAPWMKANIAKGQALQSFYEKNPFNDQQKTGYQNLFNGINGFNQSIPGLLEFANKGMGSNYQRATGGAVGSGGGYGGARVAGGLLQSGVNPFVSPQTQNYGLLDWQKLIGG